jgi:hypothetical protein
MPAKKATKKTAKPASVSNGHAAAPFLLNERGIMAAMNSAMNTALTLRHRFWEQMLDDRRDIDHECGYPKTAELTIAHYRQLYDREGIANRVVGILPDESWVVNPSLFEDEDPTTLTPFEIEFASLAKSLRGDSWYESEEGEGHPIWEYCHRIDRLSGIGHFGVLLVGINDGKTLDQPAELKPGKKSREIIYLRAFDESLIEVPNRVTDPTNRRFGMPEYYDLSFETVNYAGVNPNPESSTTEKKRVHWSRVIHVADAVESSEIWAVPRIRPNYNRIYDLRKLLGGSGEMYWRGALPPIFFETHPEYGPEVEMGEASKDSIEQMMNTLQRWGFMPGVHANQLSPTVVDPQKQIETQIDAICIQLGVPKRVFVGSERGELASSQDSRAWNNRLRARQYRYLVPRLIVPLIDRLIQMRVLSMPKRYTIKFPDLNNLTETEQADVALKRTQALVAYVAGDGRQVIAEQDYMTEFLNMSDEEAEGILDRAMEGVEEREVEELEMGLTEPDPVAVQEGF